jgi:hypothetical protein
MSDDVHGNGHSLTAPAIALIALDGCRWRATPRYQAEHHIDCSVFNNNKLGEIRR